MPYPVKTKDRITTIPPQLCTLAEAAQLLDYTPGNSSEKFLLKNARYAYAIYNGRRIKLYNRQEVLSLRRVLSPPKGYISTTALCNLLNKTYNIAYSNSALCNYLKRHGIHPKKFKSKRVCSSWPREQALAAISTLAKSKISKSQN